MNVAMCVTVRRENCRHILFLNILWTKYYNFTRFSYMLGLVKFIGNSEKVNFHC